MLSVNVSRVTRICTGSSKAYHIGLLYSGAKQPMPSVRSGRRTRKQGFLSGIQYIPDHSTIPAQVLTACEGTGIREEKVLAEQHVPRPLSYQVS